MYARTIISQEIISSQFGFQLDCTTVSSELARYLIHRILLNILSLYERIMFFIANRLVWLFNPLEDCSYHRGISGWRQRAGNALEDAILSWMKLLFLIFQCAQLL